MGGYFDGDAGSGCQMRQSDEEKLGGVVGGASAKDGSERGGQGTPKEGKYIYCVIGSAHYETFGPLGIGGRGDELHGVVFNDIAAVVSDSPMKKYSISRENMIAHEKAIEKVMSNYTVLPVRFGTIAEDEESVRKILRREYEAFRRLLGQFKDKKELGLKAMLKEAIAYKDILEKHRDIATLKEKIQKLPPAATYYQRMQIGKMVEDALTKEREVYKEEILGRLSPIADDVKVNGTYGDLMVLNAAFLLDKSREVTFEESVNELSSRYADRMQFKLVGTLPPFNFVNLVISMD